jgi:hypothetical protein
VIAGFAFFPVAVRSSRPAFGDPDLFTVFAFFLGMLGSTTGETTCGVER